MGTVRSRVARARAALMELVV
ncbi:hypothetical protein AB0O92_44170, partial [Streptomyces griseorubiginosus]